MELFILKTTNCLWHVFLLAFVIYLAPISILAHDDVGETVPHYVEIPIGGNVNITCRMNISHFNENNSSCLTFSKDYSNEPISKDNIHIINETSIVYMIRNATEQSIRYVCKCNKSGVDATHVDVGTSPTNVTDFRCRGYDFFSLTCFFTVPKNKISTRYKLKFSMSSPDYTYDCKLEDGVLPSEKFCNITLDNNKYRLHHRYYDFNLTANNSLGTLNQSITVDQYSIIVPAKPVVEIGNITSNSVTLSWKVQKYSQYSRTNGLQYKIRLRPDKFDWIDVNSNAVHTNGKEKYWADIKNLEYAFRRYDVSVWVKTGLAENNESMWSEPFNKSFVTKPRPPDNPPAMDVGSFYIDPNEQNLRLYWQQLPEYRENGPDFKYVITEIRRDGNLTNILPVQMDHTSAKYKWEGTSYYEFKLRSQNQVGQSLGTSILRVPPSRERSIILEQSQLITKVFHNQTYTVSWWKPTDLDDLDNFTVFWCIPKMESQSQCKGTISFKHFDKYTYNYTTEPQNHLLNFAVSANFRSYSTGMIWAMCAADVARELTKMDPEATPESSTIIKVQWSTECLYTAILEGYNLTYCKVKNNAIEISGECLDNKKTVSVSKLEKEFKLKDLEPFTTYKILILMYSKIKVGPISNPVYATTREDAPTPPRKLKYRNVTSNSVEIFWLPPKNNNGNLRYYTVWHNNDYHIVNSTTNDTDSEITFKIENLSSYSDYKVYITAHTVESSPASNDIHFKTLIGPPTSPRSLNIIKSDNFLLLRWGSPIIPSGRVEFYEIRVNVTKNNETKLKKISRVSSNICKMNLPPCYDRSYAYTFDVRAVNVARKSEIDYHIFSKPDSSFYSTIHQGAIKKRRHSNAEINSYVGGAYVIQETAERHIRRYERENLKNRTQINNHNLINDLESATLSSFGRWDDFTCVGDERTKSENLGQYNDSNRYEFFYSVWGNNAFYACGEAHLSEMPFMVLGVIFVSLVISTLVYTARKKYYKMSNIGLVIPPGLDENMQSIKGVDNTIENDEIRRSDEIYYDKESHGLLSTFKNDSGYLNSLHCLDKSSDVCSDPQDSEKSSQSTDSVELNEISSCSYISSPSQSPNANIREKAIPEEQFTRSIMAPTSINTSSPSSCYIKPSLSPSGYVSQNVFQKLQSKELPSYNGYTTLDAMKNPLFPPVSSTAASPIEESNVRIEDSKATNNKRMDTTLSMHSNICGYVTHKQLSEFGQSQRK